MNDLRDFGLRGLITLAINVIFLIVATLASGLMGRAAIIGPMVLGFAALWAAMIVITTLLAALARYDRRFNVYDRAPLYLGINLLASAGPLLIFAAYMALQAHQSALGSSWAERLAIYMVGFFASYIAHAIVTLFFDGQFYALINLFIALMGYLLLVLLRIYF